MIKTVLILALILGIGLPSAQSAYAQCTEGDVIHWLNLRVVITSQLDHPTEPSINDSDTFYVQLPRTDSEIFADDIKEQTMADRND